jgi:hypothetical protein
MKRKQIAILVTLMLIFVSTSIIASAQNQDQENEIKETFRICYIESSGFGLPVYIQTGITGKALLLLQVDFFGAGDTVTTIRTTRKTLEITGEHEVIIGGLLRPQLISFLGDYQFPFPRFFGSYKMPPMATIGDISFKGYAIGVEVSYIQ